MSTIVIPFGLWSERSRPLSHLLIGYTINTAMSPAETEGRRLRNLWTELAHMPDWGLPVGGEVIAKNTRVQPFSRQLAPHY